MRVFLAGATGVIGRRLLPMLLAAGHEVTGMTRTPAKLDALRACGAEAVAADALDAAAMRVAVAEARPDAVIHQLTSLPRRIDPRKIERDFVLNDRLRNEGTHNLVQAARAAGARRILAQSIAFSYAPGPAGTVHEEQDPMLLDAPRPYARSAKAVVELERTVLGADGIVLRYGYFYGPGSSISKSGSTGQDVARRRLPIVGAGTGVCRLAWVLSWVPRYVSTSLMESSKRDPVLWVAFTPFETSWHTSKRLMPCERARWIWSERMH